MHHTPNFFAFKLKIIDEFCSDFSKKGIRLNCYKLNGFSRLSGRFLFLELDGYENLDFVYVCVYCVCVLVCGKRERISNSVMRSGV